MQFIPKKCPLGLSQHVGAESILYVFTNFNRINTYVDFVDDVRAVSFSLYIVMEIFLALYNSMPYQDHPVLS